MYLTHFALRELPFGLTPDTAFAFACTPHQEALNTLLIAAANGEGFMKVTGEVGTGKTLLCRRFLSQLDRDSVSAYIPNPLLDPHGLLLALAEELRADFDRDDDQPSLLKALNRVLVDQAREGKRVVVCLDEAQAMPLETLESLRLLSNLETEKRKLLQIVLFGQPELDEKLASPSARQLRQRIVFHHDIPPLPKAELQSYLDHRMQIAGHRGDSVFLPAATRLIHRHTGGTPRLVNILAHKALLSAYGAGRHQITAAMVRNAAADTQGVKPARWWWQFAF